MKSINKWNRILFEAKSNRVMIIACAWLCVFNHWTFSVGPVSLKCRYTNVYIHMHTHTLLEWSGKVESITKSTRECIKYAILIKFTEVRILPINIPFMIFTEFSELLFNSFHAFRSSSVARRWCSYSCYAKGLVGQPTSWKKKSRTVNNHIYGGKKMAFWLIYSGVEGFFYIHLYHVWVS